MEHLLSAFLLAASLSAAWLGAEGGDSGGGCFPAGTKIATIEGKRSIEDIRPGDKVLAFTDGRLVRAEVRNSYEKKDRLLILRTAKSRLTATAEQPLLTPTGFTKVRDLKEGVEAAMLTKGQRVWARIISIKTGGVAKVYNLEVAPPHTFIAGGFIVHNKGSYPRRRGFLDSKKTTGRHETFTPRSTKQR